jgi:membrane fusion protein, multidrug efflux system
VQLAVDNEAGELVPGAYASVHFKLPLAAVNLSVPASALVFDHRGLQVATLGPGNRVVFKPVKVARDMGDSVDISSGLTADDRIIDSPPDGIADGDTVRIGPGSASAGMLAAAPSKLTPPRVQ